MAGSAGTVGATRHASTSPHILQHGPSLAALPEPRQRKVATIGTGTLYTPERARTFSISSLAHSLR
jgi:hypothetical protein